MGKSFRNCLLLIVLGTFSWMDVPAALVKAETGLSLRTSASTKAKRIRYLRTYEPVSVTQKKGEWALVRAKDGKTGWVLTKYLSQTSFVSVSIDQLNVRQGPGTEHKVVMKVGEKFPLKVIDVSGDWVKIKDFEGDMGWVSGSLVSLTPYVITKLDLSNIRSDVGTENAVKFTAEKGVVFRVLEEKEDWLKVRHADGDEGWISSNIVFGWQD